MNIVSLFSGAGGLDLGLIQAGHTVLWANDIFQDAVSTYRDNIGGFVDTRDIADIPSSEIPYADVVVGGPPCQGFSVANWKRKLNDPRNQLYEEMVRVARDKRPWFVVMENVKGIVSLGKGTILKKIEGDFSDAGYKTYWAVLNSADYGVPQKRMRFIMLGVQDDMAELPPAFPPTKTHRATDAPGLDPALIPWVTVGQALAHFPEPTDSMEIPNHQFSSYKLIFNGHLGHRFIAPDQPAPSVTGRGDDRGGVVVLHHPNNRRRMSVRELAAVQSFPDDFVFWGAKSSGYRQVANAVPPKLGQAIGRMLSENEARFGIQQKRISS
jgi:DNA (cytosine-5)-methyltransferase 1